MTVVVATRNRPDLLKRSVRAILGQSYQGHLECVVVFDQSDPSPVQLPVTGNRRLTMVTNDRSPGLAGARNSGITSGTGKYVAFCDDDDEWHQGKLQAQIELIEASGRSFCASGVHIHYGDRVVVRMPSSEVDYPSLLRSRVAELHPSTFLIRRDLFDRIGMVDEKLPASYAEDYDLLLRAARHEPIISVTRPLADVYWHPHSFFAERWQCIADALTYLLDKHPDLSADRRGLARIRGQIAFANAALERRDLARRDGWNAIRSNPLERRAYLALAVAANAISAGTVVRMANRTGRGI